MKVIVSCTTTLKRLSIFYYGIQSLLNQNYQPDVLLVNLCKDTFGDGKVSVIPQWLQDERITINLVEDVRSYTKLLPALDIATQDDIIITADDDILYSKTWLQELIDAHTAYPNAIVCSRARVMKKNMFNRYMNYSNWEIVTKEFQGKELLPLGVGGVVYKKEFFDIDFLKDKKFLEIAPTTDDLWFRMASMKKKVSVLVLPEINNSNMYIKHNHGLEDLNLNKKRMHNRIIELLFTVIDYIIDYFGIRRTNNDLAWRNILKYVKTNK